MRELKVFGECVRDGADAGSLSVDVIRGAGISKRSVALFVRTRELPGGPQAERAAGPSDADVSGPRDATAGNPLLASFLSARRNERAQEKLMSSGSRSVGGGGSGASPGGKKAGRAGGPKVFRAFFLWRGVAAHEPKSTNPPSSCAARCESAISACPEAAGPCASSTSTARTRSCGCPSRRPW